MKLLTPKVPYRILVIDDEETNLIILQNYLEDAGYMVDTASSGFEALALLHKNVRKLYDAILLDWMMPVMDGLELFEMLQDNGWFKRIPVIMQTARAKDNEIQKAIDAGVLYYITKPFSEESLLFLLKSILRRKEDRSVQLYVKRDPKKLPPNGTQFVFQTPDEAKRLGLELAKLCPDPPKAAFGLTELFLNAVEAGNLGITYEEKEQLLRNGTFDNEVKHRLKLPENTEKVATAFVVTDKKHELRFLIRDEGPGFKWKNYLTLDPKRIDKPNGRGVALAKMNFDSLEYFNDGNEVRAVVSLKPT